ncbi:MAG: hypothetical protein CME06_11870, partial [Gemmatimonadetes bacterium]|nr:hypothetical protein [Gemmatimonadota bacterium]
MWERQSRRRCIPRSPLSACRADLSMVSRPTDGWKAKAIGRGGPLVPSSWARGARGACFSGARAAASTISSTGRRTIWRRALGHGALRCSSSKSKKMGRGKGGAHCSAKAGLTLLTKVLAMELGQYYINVNAVAPGLIDVPAQR